MYGAHAASNQRNVQADQAMEISNDIIKQLTSHTEDDPNRPSHRKFLEVHGHNRIDEQELDLANFVSAAESLTLNGIPFNGPIHTIASLILFAAKDITEQQASRLKGWRGLHDRIDVQMILFQECARRLEGMSASAGTPESLSKGCILTSTAKLIRSLHKILQGFKRTAMALQRKSISESSKQNTPATVTPGESYIRYLTTMPRLMECLYRYHNCRQYQRSYFHNCGFDNGRRIDGVG
jgi:hypothetical protein